MKSPWCQRTCDWPHAEAAQNLHMTVSTTQKHKLLNNRLCGEHACVFQDLLYDLPAEMRRAL
jgi:hypothetical protein